MTFFDLFRYGCINLWRRKSRTVLTALSMTIGVMCIIVLISVGLGYEASYRESIEQLGSLTKIDVTPADQTLLDKTALLNEKAVNAFKNIEGVEAVTPVVQKSAYIKCGNFVNMVRIYGMDVSTAASFQLEPERGEAPGEGTRLHPDVMFTDDVAATFSDAKNDWAAAVDADGNALIDPLAANIKLTFDYSNLSGEQRADGDGRALPMGNFYTLNVTGICSTLNHTYSSAAFMDFDRLNELIDANADYLGARKDEKLLAEEKKNGPTYELVWIKVKNVEDVQRIAKLIRNSGLSVYSLNDMLETVRTQSRQIQGMLGAIGAVAMLVSAICVANTMMMSITERTKEIGILKVIGTSLGSISGMFLIEALILGILGGIFGLGLSYAAQKLLPVLFENMQVRSIIPAWLAVAGVAFSGVVALIAAILPARRAMRISPNADGVMHMRKLLPIILAFMLMLTGCGMGEEGIVQILEDEQTLQSAAQPEEQLIERRIEMTGDISQPGTMAIMCSEGYWRTWRVETADQNGEVKEYRYEIESMLPQDAEPSAVPVTITFNGNMLKVESEAIAMESPVQLMLNIDDGKELTFSVVHDSEEENFTVRPTDEKK